MRLAILGASGHGKVVADAAELIGWNDISFFDDAWPNLQSNGPWPVEGDTSELLLRLESYEGVVVAIGNNRIRAGKQRDLLAGGATIVSIIHPSAVVSKHASIGGGTVVFANAVINACTRIEEGCIVNTGAIVEHDCVLDGFSHVSPNAALAGGVRVGRGAWIGACASVRQLLEVGNYSVVGMGSVVTRNVLANTTVAGNPARILVP